MGSEMCIRDRYLHNSRTASKFKAELTGNAGWISPKPWNIIIIPGDSTLDEMFSEIKRGIYVGNVWYTRYQNYREGLFSTICRDAILYIENGEVKGSLTNFRISDNMLRILNNIKLIGKEVYSVKWWDAPIPTYTPHIMVSDVNFTTAVK